MADSTIRIKQVNQSELSGFVSPMIQSGMAATGQFTDVFYPRNSNPLGYITSGQTGVFKTQEDLDTLYYATISYISANFYPNSNPDNYLSDYNFNAQISGLQAQISLLSGALSALSGSAILQL